MKSQYTVPPFRSAIFFRMDISFFLPVIHTKLLFGMLRLHVTNVAAMYMIFLDINKEEISKLMGNFLLSIDTSAPDLEYYTFNDFGPIGS